MLNELGWKDDRSSSSYCISFASRASNHFVKGLQSCGTVKMMCQSSQRKHLQRYRSFMPKVEGRDWDKTQPRLHMSQFWYNEETATRLAEEVLQQAGRNGRIACLSSPSVYQKLKQLGSERPDGTSAVLLEFDRRFAAYGDEFIFYDYNNPLCLREDILPQSFDIVMADPPYLSEECLGKVALTVKYLTKGKILLCTGAIMEEHAGKLMDLKMCRFLPKHSHNLANEFRCYINYESSLL